MYNEYSNMFNPRQGYSYVKRQNTVVDEEVISLAAATDLIRESIGSEKQDELFYTSLIEKAPNDKAKEIISSIRDDEKRHNQILRFIYSNLTGEIIEDNKDVTQEGNNNSSTYEDDINAALFGELDAVKKYRKIMGAMPSMKTHTLLMSILTDELRHANLYNYLITKYINKNNNM